MEKKCFNPNDPNDCVWVPASNSGTRTNTNGDPIVGEDTADEPPRYKQMCYTDNPSDCVWVPAGGETRYDQNGNPILGEAAEPSPGMKL